MEDPPASRGGPSKPPCKKCVVPLCKSNSTRHPNKLFVSCPAAARIKWFEAASLYPQEFSPRTVTRFCEDHFDLPNDMENYVQYRLMGNACRAFMKKGCVPTKFECQMNKNEKRHLEEKQVKKRKEIIEECLKEHEQKQYMEEKQVEKRRDIIETCLKEHEEKTKNNKDFQEPTKPRLKTMHASADRIPDVGAYEEAACYVLTVPKAESNYAIMVPKGILQDLQSGQVALLTQDEEMVDPTVNDPLSFDAQSVCRCCLSGARSLRTLGRSQRWVGAALCAAARVCWECAATLRRMHSFRERARTADEILTRAEQTQITSEIKSLSTLTCCFKDTYDFKYEYSDDNETKPRNRKQKLHIRVETPDTDYLEANIKQGKEMMEIYHDHDYSTVNDDNNSDLANDEPLIECDVKEEIHDPLDEDLTEEQTHHTIDKDSELRYKNTFDDKNNDTTANNDENDFTGANDDDKNVTTANDHADNIIANDKPLIQYDINELEIDNALEDHKYTVRYINEEELRQRRQRDRENPKYMNSKKSYKCETCIQLFSAYKYKKKHMNRFHSKDAGSCVCGVCQKGFLTPEAHSKHYRQHYATYCCRECGLVERKEYFMKKHIEDHAARRARDAIESSARKSRAERQKFFCDTCGVEFIRKYQIQNHLKSGQCPGSAEPESTKLELLWPECGICYEKIDYSFMSRHINTCHYPTEKPKCLQCNKEYSFQHTYNRHCLHMHMPRKYKCKFCYKRLATKYLRQLHIDMNHIVKMSHKCDQCDKAFATMRALNAHKNRVHAKKYRKLCMYCGKRCMNLTVLTEHMRVHTGEKPYQCAHCHCAFAQRSNILSHIKSVHKEVMVTRAHAK